MQKNIEVNQIVRDVNKQDLWSSYRKGSVIEKPLQPIDALLNTATVPWWLNRLHKLQWGCFSFFDEINFDSAFVLNKRSSDGNTDERENGETHNRTDEGIERFHWIEMEPCFKIFNSEMKVLRKRNNLRRRE